MKRKAIPKKTRFEVFKRDSFKCQYCGAGSPDVVLHVDHIKPFSGGGDNSILNLITACSDCNLGKSNKELSDAAVVNKQVDQLRQLNERREQLKMMATWREQLSELDNDALEICANAWSSACAGAYSLNDAGKKSLKTLIKKFGVPSVLDAMDIACDQYLEPCSESTYTSASVEAAFKKIGGICSLKARPEWEQKVRYMRGILINRFKLRHGDYDVALDYLTDAHKAGGTLDSLQELCKTAKSFDQVLYQIDLFISGVKQRNGDDHG